MDFGFQTEPIADITVTPSNNQPDATDVDKPVDVNGNEPPAQNEPPAPPAGNEPPVNEPPADENDIQLTEGQTVDIDGNIYTVDADGNLLDKDNNVFKKADEVKDFLKEFNINTDDDDENVINIENIQKQIGIEITDDKGNPVVFDNTVDGIKSYVESVIDAQQKDLRLEGVNTILTKYPFVRDVINYYVANGNSLEGFGQQVDRSGITIKDDDEAQQESIIRTAWKEQKRTGDVESYINYLKSAGLLLSSAKTELEGLQNADKARKEELERQAQAEQEKQMKDMQDYWNGVNEVIKSRKIAGYTIPETITRTVDGKRIGVTVTDFFNYLYQVDKNGNSQYDLDLLKLTPESRRDDEILRAYLLYTGGSYGDLVKMAINEDRIKTLKLQAKNNKPSTFRATRKTNNQPKNIDLGYN